MKTKFSVAITIIFAFLNLISCKEKNTLEDEHDHTEAIGLIVYNMDKPYFKVINAQIDTTVAKEFLVPYQQEMTFEVKFIDTDGEIITPTEQSKNFSWVLDDTSLVSASFVSKKKYKFKMRGIKNGKTLVEFRLNHYEHPDFKTPKVPLVVK